MGIPDKMGYVRGLADGLKIEETTPEGKLLLAIVDLLGEMTEGFHEVALLVHDLEESVDDLITDVYEEESEDGEGSRIRMFPGTLNGFEGDEEDGQGNPRCVSCGHPIEITSELLRAGTVKCPECGQQMTLEIQDGDSGCGGGCCGHHHHHGDNDET